MNDKLLLSSGIIGLVFLIAFGVLTSDIQLKHPELFSKEATISMISIQNLYEDRETWLDNRMMEEYREDMAGLNCSPEVDKDDDNIPDNLDIEGPIDWSYCELIGFDLSNRDFSGSYLAGVNLYGSDLSNSDLSGTNLSHAKIYKVNLSNTDLTYTNLSHANLCGAQFGLQGANVAEHNGPEILGDTVVAFDFTGTNLSHADFDHANLYGAILTDAVVRYTNFHDSQLTSVNLSGKDLTGTILTEANLTNANLVGVDLSGKDLTGTILTGANLSNTILTGTDLSNAVLTNAMFTNANLEDAIINNTILDCIEHSICKLNTT